MNMYHKLIFLMILQLLVNLSATLHFVVHPDRDLSATAIITKHGYPLELHELVTDDGYILAMHRIPRGRNNTSNGSNNKYPVLLVHGTCGCIENFIVLGPEKSIGFYLADRGFDIWLLSTRGSRYSRKHRTLNPDTDKRFWNFGWHEVAVSDTPTAVDYILKTTNTNKLFYIGHSQGSTSYFAFASERPEYNSKIYVAVTMAPSCLLGDVRNVAKILGKHTSLIQELTNFFNIYELFPNGYTEWINDVAKTLCSEMTFFIDICYAVLYFGLIEGDMAQTSPQLLFNTSPAHCSIKQLLHYFQLIYTGLFRKYDYGAQGNLQMYGTEFPPLYSFSNMTAPIALFYALADNICPKEGVRQLAKSLPNAVLYPVTSGKFGHIDFILGKRAPRLVYERVYQLFMRYL